MKKYLLLILIITSSFTDQKSFNISSEEVFFDEGLLKLKGNVQINHEIGKFSSTKATIKEAKLDRNQAFDTALLEGSVLLEMHNNEQLICEKVLLDYVNKNIHFSSPIENPIIFSSMLTQNNIFIEGNNADLNFFSDAFIDKDSIRKIKTFIFYDNAKVIYKNYKFIGDKITIKHNEDSYIEEIIANGGSKIELLDDKNTYLYSPYDIHIDNNNRIIYSEAIENKQLSYHDKRVSIYANSFNFSYDEDMQPQLITLKGDVSFILDTNISKKNSYGSSDTLMYNTKTKKITLIGSEDKKVLFSIDDGSYKMCANELHIEKDLSTNKENIRGIGPMRIYFSNEEEKIIQKVFSNYSNEKRRKNNTKSK